MSEGKAFTRYTGLHSQGLFSFSPMGMCKVDFTKNTNCFFALVI